MLLLQDLFQKKNAVLGFGKEGKSVCNYLLKNGIIPTVLDKKEFHLWDDEDRRFCEENKIISVTGSEYLEALNFYDVVWRSPGVWRLMPELRVFEQNGGLIMSQTQWFFEHCPALIIGVTGTKGKGTTCTLIYEMLSEGLRQHGVLESPYVRTSLTGKVILTGNIGKIDPLACLDDLTERDVVVFELSSFQLQGLSLSPAVAVVLMVTSEHLDHHQTVQEYIEAKSSITKYQREGDLAVINNDFQNSNYLGSFGAGTKLFFSRQHDLDFGCYLHGEDLLINTPASGKNLICKTSEIGLKGLHNIDNVAAASLVGISLGVPLHVVGDVVKSFRGLEHRLEFAGEHEGVQFYNDSFSTVPETAIAAIKAFSEPKIVILGGSEKHADFTELAEVVHNLESIKAVILIGVTAERIKLALEKAGGFKGQILEGALSMKDIFVLAKRVASPGDVVLLSPACASFGMFKNYKDRGDQFKYWATHWLEL